MTVDEVATAVDELPQLHATWWMSSRLDTQGWLDLMVTENNAAGAYMKSLGPDVVAERLSVTRRHVVTR